MTAPDPIPHDDAPAPAPARTAIWEDVIDIFYAPSQVYERRRDGRFGAALAIVFLGTAAIVALFWNVLSPVFEATVELALAAAAAEGNAPPAEAMASARSIGTTMAAVGAVVGVPIAILGTAAGVWLFGRLLDAGVGFAQAMAIVTLANVPRMLGWIVIGVQALLGDGTQSIFAYMIAPTRFMDPETTSQLTLALAGRFELFTLWATVLIAIGVSVVARVPRAKGYVVAAAVWLVAGALMAIQSA